MINPPNNNKFIGLQDQQTLGQLNDPLQAERDFLAKRMSQPVPVPGGQTPMMQQQKGKMQTVQNDPKLQKGSDASYGISGYVNTEKEYKQALQEKNHPNVYSSPAKQTNYPHAGTKYNHVGVQNLQEKGFIFDDKKGPYVVNKELTGTSRDTLRLPKNVWRSSKNEPYNSGNLIDDVEYTELANKANKK